MESNIKLCGVANRLIPMTYNCVLSSKTWQTGILILAITLFSGIINVIFAQEYPDSVVPVSYTHLTLPTSPYE